MTVVTDVGAIEWVVVRFTDSAGIRWEYNEPWDPEDLADPVRRLRRVRHHRRSLRWWLWRFRHFRLRRTLLREPSDW
jgi:hypothetical protein